MRTSEEIVAEIQRRIATMDQLSHKWGHERDDAAIAMELLLEWIGEGNIHAEETAQACRHDHN